MEAEGTILTVKISGLMGGHSGAEIDKNRANANVLMGRFLYGLKKKCEYELVSVNGGQKDNAIPRECTAVLAVGEESVSEILSYASWLQEKPPCPGKRPFLPAPEGRGAFLSGLRASAQSLLSDGNHRFLGSWRKDDPPFARQGTYFGGGTACPHQVGRAIVSAG